MKITYLGRGDNPTGVSGLGRVPHAENQRVLCFMVEGDDGDADKLGRQIEKSFGGKK